MEVWVSVCVCVYSGVCGSTSPGQFGCLVFSLFDAPRALRTLQNITQHTNNPWVNSSSLVSLLLHVLLGGTPHGGERDNGETCGDEDEQHL